MASEAQRIYAAMQAVANTEARQRARIAELEAALEPFAAVKTKPECDDAQPVLDWVGPGNPDHAVYRWTVGDFRRAAAALQKDTDHGE